MYPVMQRLDPLAQITSYLPDALPSIVWRRTVAPHVAGLQGGGPWTDPPQGKDGGQQRPRHQLPSLAAREVAWPAI